MMELRLDDKLVKRFLSAGREISRGVERDIVSLIRKRIADEVIGRAQSKAPVLFGTLSQSVDKLLAPGGATIRFGGQAKEYAAKQHFDRSLSHTGPRRGRYVYEGTVGYHVGEENIHPVTGTVWRRQRVRYSKRHESARFGNKKGQSHFLFGAPNSAVEELMPWMIVQINKAGTESLERRLREAGAR